jgi:hypothetical protein
VTNLSISIVILGICWFMYMRMLLWYVFGIGDESIKSTINIEKHRRKLYP